MPSLTEEILHRGACDAEDRSDIPGKAAVQCPDSCWIKEFGIDAEDLYCHPSRGPTKTKPVAPAGHAIRLALHSLGEGPLADGADVADSGSEAAVPAPRRA
jgi:hypothetical protein